MKLQRLLPLTVLACTASVIAAPSFFDDAQAVLGATAGLKDTANRYLSDAKQTILRGKEELETWYHEGQEFVKKSGLLYELVRHPKFTSTLRVTEPDLCDSSVKQYSGYFDVAEDKHLFFWFFESRTAPKDAPLILWLNGGPGCSSSTGLLFELGPCSIGEEGRNVTHNPHSWNSNANIIFLDQPVNVGFSYADGNTRVNNSPVAGKDVYAFLELFLNRFPQYSKQPFHIAAESYGGRTRSGVRERHLQGEQGAQVRRRPRLPVRWSLCAVRPEGPECQGMRAKVPTCQRLVKSCYQFNSRFACMPAMLYCNAQLMQPIMQTGKNPYDARRPCDRSKDGDLCYKQMTWIENWLNNPKIKTTLGVNPDLNFAPATWSAVLLPELINDGVRLLVYAGNADMMCNYIGNERWVDALETKFAEEFKKTKAIPWIPLTTGKVAGTVRSAGTGLFTAGNVTFVEVYEAGHMVPFDQPEAALDLINRWITDIPLSFQEASGSSIPPL
ncbi:hypothetical protein D9611_014972 [Ephemerocybe angulata]|uniref:Carboxypeptidase n=1 Tax=Ephemerocybe angulata TaxID=980116 RepID=A0A8H5B7Y3_9AGAR|nr:hypothetical protein D9611_014972 [Tulosesus angulatus]